MSFLEKIIEALYKDNDNLDMTIEDVRVATVQEVLLYYTYCTIVEKKWCLNFDRVPNIIKDGYIIFELDHDILTVAYFITQSSWLLPSVSYKTERRIVKYSELYQIQFDKKIMGLFTKLSIDLDYENRKKLVFSIHNIGNNTKSARNV